MRLAEVQVHVICDGCPLEEYSSSREGERTLSCYIPSEAGKEFKVVSRSSLSTETLAGKLTIDGSRVRSFTVKPLGTQDVGSVHVSQTVQRPFIFSDIRISDAADALVPCAANMQQIGVIQVDLFRTVPQRRVPWTPREDALNALGGGVPESAKIIGRHQTSLGDSQTVEDVTPQRTTVKLIDPRDSPYARFIFRYRAREVLRAQGIILEPGPPEPQAHLPSISSAISDPPPVVPSSQSRQTLSTAPSVYRGRLGISTPNRPSAYHHHMDKRRTHSSVPSTSTATTRSFTQNHLRSHPYAVGAASAHGPRRSSHPPTDIDSRLTNLTALEARCATAIRNMQALGAQLHHAKQTMAVLGHGVSSSGPARMGAGMSMEASVEGGLSGTTGGSAGASSSGASTRPRRHSCPIVVEGANGNVIDLTDE